MNNSDNISDDFIAELEAYFQCASRHLISYLGITQNPDTKNYAIVMEYAENDIKEKIMKWQSVLGWFPTEESRSDEEAKQFEEADDEKSKEDRRYRAGMYNPTPKSQEPSAVDQDCRELPDIQLLINEHPDGEKSLQLFFLICFCLYSDTHTLLLHRHQ
ncbi:unnamed protein product [Rhizophagus irregularis]|nr:unnamed protein product [Rhizophagus irregularis]